MPAVPGGLQMLLPLQRGVGAHVLPSFRAGQCLENTSNESSWSGPAAQDDLGSRRGEKSEGYRDHWWAKHWQDWK